MLQYPKGPRDSFPKESFGLEDAFGMGFEVFFTPEACSIELFTAKYKPVLPQGLGTGQLYHNNIPGSLEIRRGELLYNGSEKWFIRFD